MRDSRGNLYIAYRKKYKQQYETAYHIFVAKSSDDGVHWRLLNGGRPIETVGDFNQRVPAITVDQQDVLHVVWYGSDETTDGRNENQIKYTRSIDAGESWSTWQNLNWVAGYANQPLWQEHPTIFVDQANRLYVVWEGRDNWYNAASQAKFTKSIDGGLSWTPWVNIAPSMNSRSRPSLVATADNHLYVFVYGTRNGRQQILYASSPNGGAQWSRWRQVAASDQDQRHVSVAVDNAGQIHVVWRQLPFSPRNPQDQGAQIYYAMFDGAVWSTPVRVGSHLGVAQTYPSIAIDSTSTVWITWVETTTPYNFPQDAPTTGAISYAVKSAIGWSSPLRYADGGNHVYPSLPRTLAAGSAQMDIVWLEALPTTNVIHFAHLSRPTHFVPTAIMHMETKPTFFSVSNLATAWMQAEQQPPSLRLGAFFQPDQILPDLRSILLLIGIVSVYVIVKFLVGRWLAVVFR
ncbi:MAG: sialidase family protein [Caldilineaceae bacterium]